MKRKLFFDGLHALTSFTVQSQMKISISQLIITFEELSIPVAYYWVFY